MTVSTTTSRADYTGNGVTTAFAVPFYFLDNSHLLVLRTQISTGTITTLALTTDYTVSGAGVAAGGTITCATAPTADQKLSILRNVPLTQLTHYVENDPFPAASHERALDQLTMEIQQVGEVAGRALQLPANAPSSGVSTLLPLPSANKVLAWNPTATGLQNMDAITLATVVTTGTANVDIFSGDGSTVQFALTANPGALNNIDVSISGVTQKPGVDYTWVSGTTLTFTSAPPSGANNILVRYWLGLPQGYTDSAASRYAPAGTGAVAITVQEKLRESVGIKDFGAYGDGITDDTLALTKIAAAGVWGATGGWKTYSVTDTTDINRTKEAIFLKGGFAELPPTTAPQFGGSVTVNRFGGQLGSLLRKLSDPLCQSVNVVFSGDSITWGVGATGSPSGSPRDKTLSDPRNLYATGAWVNLVKRWVGDYLGRGATVALSNHSASPSGESVATWTKSVAVYPEGPRFTSTITGSATDTVLTDIAALCNRKRSLSVNPNAKVKLSFPFTGDTIEVVFACIVNGASYNLRVNGVTVASAQPTRAGVSGLTGGYGRSWTHTFPRVVDALVELEAVHHDNVSGVDSLYIEALRFPKKVRLSNQATIGIDSAGVLAYHMPTSRETGSGLKPIGQISGVTETPSGTTNKSERDSPASSTGVQTLYGSAAGGQWDIVVPVGSTKDKLEIRYSSTSAGCDILVIVGGSTVDSFSTSSNAPGGSFGYAKKRTVTLPGGTTSVTLRTVVANYGGGAAYTNYFYLEGIASYSESDIAYPTNNGFNDGLACLNDDDFFFLAIGTNDRIDSDTHVTSPQNLSSNVDSILNLIPAAAKPVLITPAPAAVDGPPTMFMSTREAGSVLRELGSRRAIDTINLQSLFAGISTAVWTTDGLHPNDLGHKIYAAAVIQAIESSN